MTDVFATLPRFEWRGKQYPVTARSVGFNHEGVFHVLQYRDFEVIEQTGARNLAFRYTIPLRQDIAKGPYKNLFTEGLPALFRDVLNRAEGELVDPVHGPFTCVPRSYDEETDPNKRDGADVKLEFQRQSTVDEDQSLQPPTLQDIAGDAGALDADVKKANWHQEPSPEGTTDILSAVNGFLFQGVRAIDKVVGAMHDVAFRCEKIENTVDVLTDPKNWPIRSAARRLRESTIRLATFGDSPQQRRPPITTTRAMALTTLAALVGLSVDALLILNPQLARSPTVPAGTTIRVPARA